MTSSCHTVGAFVLGAPTAPRALVRHDDLLTAYADGIVDDNREAYLSHFTFGPDLQAHYAAHRQSVAGFAGPCCCRWLVLDIDRPDLANAQADARKLVAVIRDRYGTDDAPVYFSGGKGFHVLVELAHRPPPAVGFQRVARTFAELLAEAAGVPIDTAIYDSAHLIRLPNTQHPRTGLFRRRIDCEALYHLDLAKILDLARQPAGDGLPATQSGGAARLAADWELAEREVAQQTAARAADRQHHSAPDVRAPRYFIDFMRFAEAEGERHLTLFRCSAWLAEQGAPPSLCQALLAEPGCDNGLSPADVARQIRCGVEHARRQAEGGAP